MSFFPSAIVIFSPMSKKTNALTRNSIRAAHYYSFFSFIHLGRYAKRENKKLGKGRETSESVMSRARVNFVIAPTIGAPEERKYRATFLFIYLLKTLIFFILLGIHELFDTFKRLKK